ncbi:hypothetical protein [Paraburkholderia youngii]|uniref:hypothetical protein n=1 Tax=Paraburkholderia youngii TaxID=2782701 RepID=UPI003D1DAB5A
MEQLSVDALRAKLTFPPIKERTAIGKVTNIEIALPDRTLDARAYRPAAERIRGCHGVSIAADVTVYP